MDRYALYELCVQAPGLQAAFLRAVHGGRPLALREDFSGRGAIARAWLELDERATAWAVDRDPEALGREEHPRLVRRVADVLAVEPGEPRFEVVHAGNFSLGYLPGRGELVRYLGLARKRLAPGGVFVADTFGGASAFRLGASERVRFLPDGRRVRCVWQRTEADPVRGTVVNSISFRVDRDGEVVGELAEAFVYRWRLWSLPELADACAEVGFGKFEVYAEIGEGAPRQIAGRDLQADYSVCVVAR